MDKTELILYRLDQEEKRSADFRTEMRTTFERVFAQWGKMDNRIDEVREEASNNLLKALLEPANRLSALEKWRWIVTGALIMLTALIGWYVNFVPKSQ
jgi:hypothetical protein